MSVIKHEMCEINETFDILKQAMHCSSKNPGKKPESSDV